MTSLLEKLILTGFGKMQVVNFSIQEMILPQLDGVTRIVYEWNQYYRDPGDLNTTSYKEFLQLLCTIQDKRQNVHFITQGRVTIDDSGSNNHITSEKDTQEVLFVSDQDICLTYGQFRGDDAGANPGIVPYGFNRPLGLNDLNIVDRTGVRDLVGNPTYNYSTNSDLPLADFKDILGYSGKIVANDGRFTAVVKYVEVGMPIDELKQLILGL